MEINGRKYEVVTEWKGGAKQFLILYYPKSRRNSLWVARNFIDRVEHKRLGDIYDVAAFREFIYSMEVAAINDHAEYLEKKYKFNILKLIGFGFSLYIPVLIYAIFF